MVPKFKEYFYPFLIVLQDKDTHCLAEIRDSIKDTLQLSAEDLLETTKGGRNKHTDRTKWAITYLKKLGLIESPKQGLYIITNKGESLLEKYGSRLNLSILRDLDGYKEMSRVDNTKHSFWVEGHKREDGSYVAGYYSNFKATGVRKKRRG